MPDFKPGDWVRIIWHDNEDVEGATGTIQTQKCDFINACDDMYTVAFDKPLDSGVDHADVEAFQVRLIQPHNIIAIESAADGATVVTVHDPDDRRVDLVCSSHPRFSTFTYLPSITETERSRLYSDAVKYAHRHAESCHTIDALDRG